MSRKQSIIYMALVVMLLPVSVLRSAAAGDQATGRLSIEIRPDLLMTAPATLAASPQATDSSGSTQVVAQFDLPLGVKIRLAKGVAAEMTIEPAADPINTLPGFASGDIVVNGSATPLVSGAPATLQINQSGVHQVPVGIVLRGDANFASGSLPLRLSLRSQDGILNWTGTTQLVWTATQP
jgi:hypothetical protein